MTAMTRRTVVLAAWVVLGLATWAISSSFIYCLGFSRFNLSSTMALFKFPYLQWFEAAPWYDYSQTVKLWLIISALCPLLVVLLVYNSRRNNPGRGLRDRRPF